MAFIHFNLRIHFLQFPFIQFEFIQFLVLLKKNNFIIFFKTLFYLIFPLLILIQVHLFFF